MHQGNRVQLGTRSLWLLLLGSLVWSAASAQSLDASFGTYRAPEGIACAQSPFGARLVLGADEEPLVMRRNAASGSILFSQHAGTGSGLAAERTQNLTVAGTTVTGAETVALDFNGDGEQEVALATRRVPSGAPNHLVVQMFRRCRNLCEFPLESRGEWRLDPVGTETLLEFSLGRADLDPSIGGDELIVASRWSNNTVRVFVLRGSNTASFLDPNNNGLGRATYTHTANEADDLLRMAVGDVLLEGRKQIILMTRVNNPSEWRYRLIRYTGGINQDSRLSMQSFQWPRAGFGGRAVGLYAGDLGGSAADELIMQQQEQSGLSVDNTIIRVHYFTTQRDQNNEITGVTLRRDTIDGSINTFSIFSDRTISFAIGELDRRPPQELVAVYRGSQTFEPQKMRVEGYRVVFNTAGFPTGIALAQPSILTRIDLTSSTDAVEAQALAVGDANGDGIGDAYVTFNQGGTSRLFRLSMASPAGDLDGPPDTSTFVQRGSFTYTDGGSTSSFGLALGDFDFDSVLARLGTTCRRVQEPTLRSLVMLPPTWSRLQSDDDSEATIGQQGTSGGSTETRFSRFQSHDVSGYIGVQVDGEPFGIGAKGSAKATFGYNFQAERGEVRGSSVETTVTEGRSEAGDRGLVVLEDNQFDCYDYDVTRGGVLAPNSDLRSCERLSQLTSVFGTNLDDWNTFGAFNTAGGQRAQWTSLEPDWASIALFIPPSLSTPTAVGFEATRATDGLFDTAYRSFTFLPNLQIDLGEVRELTQVRIHKPTLGTPRMALFLSESPMIGNELPGGPGVIRIDPDPKSRNGVETWNVRLVGPAPNFEPLRARYVRVQSIETSIFSTLTINELQVFAADHKQPPQYPAAVCDPNASDDVFLARMVGPGPGAGLAYRTIQIRGRLKWLGTNQNYADCGTVAAGIPRPNIWGTTTIGVGTSATSWDLFQGTTNLVGVSSSISHSVRAGAEIEFEAGAVVQAIGGGAYEFSTGVTTEESSTMEWGSGLNYGGTAAGTSGGTNPLCGFRAHPYAYVRTERSNIGYQHQLTVVDYIVPDVPNWSRLGPNLPPQDCFPPRAEPVFGSGFEP